MKRTRQFMTEGNRERAATLADEMIKSDGEAFFSAEDWVAIALELACRLEEKSGAGVMDQALAKFPDSQAAVQVVASSLAIALEPQADVGDDRHERIRAAIAACSSEQRTRALVICSALMRIGDQLRTLVLTVKEEHGDADVVTGSATVTPDGWLVVAFEDREVARVPFNPNRPSEEAAELGTSMLAEYVRIHVQGEGEVSANVGAAVNGNGRHGNDVRPIRVVRGGVDD
jgi:hypothetical protein